MPYEPYKPWTVAADPEFRLLGDDRELLQIAKPIPGAPACVRWHTWTPAKEAREAIRCWEDEAFAWHEALRQKGEALEREVPQLWDGPLAFNKIAGEWRVVGIVRLSTVYMPMHEEGRLILTGYDIMVMPEREPFLRKMGFAPETLGMRAEDVS